MMKMLHKYVLGKCYELVNGNGKTYRFKFCGENSKGEMFGILENTNYQTNMVEIFRPSIVSVKQIPCSEISQKEIL